MNRKNPLKNKKGMTMVNVIVAFVILVMMVGMFSGVAVFTSNAVRRAEEERKKTAAALQQYYLGRVQGKLCAGTDEHGNVEGRPAFVLTDGREDISVASSLFSYTQEDTTLYSYGEYKATEEVVTDETP